MGLTPFEWFKVGASIISAIGAGVVYLWGRDRAIAISDAVHDERASHLVTQTQLLKALEEDRHAMRNEVDSKLGAFVSRDVYLTDRRNIEQRVERVEQRSFGAGV